MISSNTRTAVEGYYVRTIGIFAFLLLLAGLQGGKLQATSLAAYGLTGTTDPTPIPALTIFANQPETLVINGSFGGNVSLLNFSATLANGSSLPSWMELASTSGTFTFTPPGGAIGNLYQIRVTAKDGSRAGSTSFYLIVEDGDADCTVDANTDGLARMLGCASKTVRLRGYTSSGNYRWTGPNGFVSSEAEPVVKSPGLYILTDEACARRSIVEVLPTSMGCSGGTDKNKLPVVELKANRTSGTAPVVVDFDASGSTDDGTIIDYVLSWDGGSATGEMPTVVFPEGTHDVTLTVTDNTGAKSTDRMRITSRKDVPVYAYWLEAECATVGGNWSSATEAAASGDRYVVSQQSAINTAPGDVPDNRIRFAIDKVVAADYSLFARIAAADDNSDSYWVRVNGGTWTAWKSGIATTRGFQWNEAPFNLALRSGSNTVDIAFREAGTRLDKLLITTGSDMPGGEGETATNCVSNIPPVARFTATPSSGIGPLNVSLDASKSSDPDGSIAKYDWAWNGGSGSGMRPQLTLSPGSYRVTLTVTDNDGAKDNEVVAIEVDAAPVTSETTTSAARSFWLEAECAQVGSRWASTSTSAASGGKFVVATSGTAYGSAPADKPDNYVRFELSSARSGDYTMFARINAADGLHDSYWIRVNGGSWISWSSGILQGKGFHWNEFNRTLRLKDGQNTVDFAFRESGTQLDKIFVTSTKSSPSGLGENASNCVSSEAVATDIWMEAECGTLGAAWSSPSSTASSGGAYTVFEGASSTSSPSTNSKDQMTFQVTVTERAVYRLFLRMDAKDTGHNSFWVRMDEGKWIKFWKEAGGADLLTRGMEWREVSHDGKEISFDLSPGEHTITIGNRESGTLLDKLLLTASASRPTGQGGAATNCQASSQSISMFSNSTQQSPAAPADTEPVTVADAPSALSIFPNPVVSDLNLQLTGSYEGRVDAYLIDASGRTLREIHLEKAGDQLQVPVDVSDLLPGMYHLRVIEGDQQLVKPFIKR